jgi:hypothetical protein
MKKILILIVLLAAYSNIFAYLTQSNWRWRNDDGTETTATWKDNQNTQVILTTKGEIWRLRQEVYNISLTSVNVIDTLQYATSTGGPWTNIDTTAGSNPFVIAGVSAFVTQAEPTSAQLTGVAYTFAPGKIMVDSMLLENYDLADQQRTEFEWAIKSTSNILPNTTYYFRQWGATQTIDGANTYPSLITAGVLPIKLTGFAVSREDKKVRLEWGTTSEQNNIRFEIQRSSDGRTWKTIANVTGHGTTTALNNYKVYDERPLSGINYYIIKQYDVDNHSYLSDIRSVKMPEVKTIISVYPNPAHSAVNFSIVNKGASNIEATLTNINGSIIHQEIFKSVPANTINKLNLGHQPAKGIYILKLKAEGFSESTRVIIK